MRYRVTSGLPLRIRLRKGSTKTVFQPGEIAKLPEEVAEQYLRLGLVEEVDGEVKVPKPTPAPKPVAPKPRKPLTEKLAKVNNVSDVPKSSD